MTELSNADGPIKFKIQTFAIDCYDEVDISEVSKSNMNMRNKTILKQENSVYINHLRL